MKLLFICFAFILGSPLVFGQQGGARDGGGGNTLPGKKIGAQALSDIMDTSVPVVYAAFANLSKSYASTHAADSVADPIEKELFSGPKTIFDIVLGSSVEENTSAPCPTKFGPQDGAGPGSTPDSICIGIFDLSTKLTIDNANSQTQALMAREYSHLLGIGEKPSTWLQKEVYDLMPQYAGAADTVLEGMQQISVLLPQVQSLALSADYNSATCSALTSAQTAYLKLQSVLLPSNGLSLIDILDVSNDRVYQGNAYRLKYLIALTCGQDLTSYTQAFQGKTQLGLVDVEALVNQSFPNVSAPSFTLRNILDKSSTLKLQAEISDLAQFLNQLQNELSTLESVDPQPNPKISS